MAANITDAQSNISDIWLFDLVRGSSYRLTSHPGMTSYFALWSPNGDYVGYDITGLGKLYRKAASGAGAEEVLFQPEPPMRADDWSRDGPYLIGETGGQGSNLWVLPLSGNRKQYSFIRDDFRQRQARISPDSRWVAYASNRTGRNEVYVTSFPTAAAQTQISTAGGDFPAWSRDGKELFYIGADSRLTAVAVKAGKQFEAGRPHALFQVRFSSISANISRFDVSPDGRFLIPVEPDASMPQSIVAVINWTAGLTR